MLTSLVKTGWKDIAGSVQQKEGPILVSETSFTDTEHDSPVFHSRLLGLDDYSLKIEMPLDRKAQQFLRRGRSVYVLLIHRNHRWEIHCEILGYTRCKTASSVQAPACVLAYPVEDVQVQRRSYYRADLTGLNLAPVRLIPLDPITHRPMPGLCLQGHAVNISGGGIGVSVSTEHLEPMDDYDAFKCELHFKCDDQELDLALTANRAYFVKGRAGWIYLGLSFDFEGEHQHQKIADELVHFSACVQRYQLSRRRAGTA